RFGPHRSLARHPEAVASALNDQVSSAQRGRLGFRLFDCQRVVVEAAWDGLAACVLQGPGEFLARYEAAVIDHFHSLIEDLQPEVLSRGRGGEAELLLLNDDCHFT